MKSRLEAADFLDAFGEYGDERSELQQGLEQVVGAFDFSYRELDRTESENCVLEILQRLEDGALDSSGSFRLDKWNKGWAENLVDFVDSGFDTSSLVPKYYRGSSISRYNGCFIATTNPSFQYDFFQVLRSYITLKFLRDRPHIFEFACGPGHNIVAMNEILGGTATYFHGLDWASSSVEIIGKIAEYKGISCSGRRFDFFDPDYSLEIPPGSVVLTFGGLEQVGEKHGRFLEFLMSKSPALCVNVEPIHELYGTRLLLDYLASKYHYRRNYLRNYLSSLLLLEKHGKVEIDKITRVPFGGMYHEGWSIVVWKPL